MASQVRGLRRDAADRLPETASALRLALSEAGVTFVKLGQMLSTRADLLPAPFITELSRLQNRVQPESWKVIGAAIEGETGARRRRGVRVD